MHPRSFTGFLLAFSTAAVLLAQPRAVQTGSPSTVQITTSATGDKTVEIQNVSYQVSWSGVPGRPKDERLLLRKQTHSKQILGEKGIESAVVLEAWPLGTDTKFKPVYSVKATGTDGQVVEGALFVVSRGLDDVEWWSVYKLGTGQHLFDTYVPLLNFSISRETLTTRYAGLDVPSDDVKDARLKQPKVIGVLTYASEDRVIREWLLTCDDPKRAQLLRSYADTTRKLTLAERAPNSQILTLSFRENFPSPANPIDLIVPIASDDLDVAHAQLPAQFHLSAWRR